MSGCRYAACGTEADIEQLLAFRTLMVYRYRGSIASWGEVGCLRFVQRQRATQRQEGAAIIKESVGRRRRKQRKEATRGSDKASLKCRQLGREFSSVVRQHVWLAGVGVVYHDATKWTVDRLLHRNCSISRETRAILANGASWASRRRHV